MKLEHKFLVIAVIAITLAVPVALATQSRTNQLKVENAKNTSLQLKLNALKKQVQLDNVQVQEKARDQQTKQQQIDDLQKQLQAKRDTQATVAAEQAQPAPVAVYSSGNCEAYRGIVAQYSWNTSVALAVMHAESGCNPSASSPTCDHGLMQVNCVHADLVDGNLNLLNDPATNIRVAYEVYSGAGWNAWTTFSSGAYLRYL